MSPAPEQLQSLGALAARIKALDPSATVKQLIDLISAGEGEVTPVETAVVDRLKPIACSTVAILAAICDTFVIEELDAALEKIGDKREEGALELLLAHCDAIVVAERPRLRLTPEARAAIIVKSHTSVRFATLLDSSVKDDQRHYDEITGDPVRVYSAWLRGFLSGAHGDLARAPIDEARAAVVALEALAGVRHLLSPTAPTLEVAQRYLQLAELLEPLRIVIGSEGGWDGSAGRDRYVGRNDERRVLRSFVGELDAEGLGESLARVFTFGARSVESYFRGSRPDVLMLEAQGGLGKTSLVAKFVLDHVHGARSTNFLFAYIDFDRAALDARDPTSLLLEVVRQVALQTGAADAIELHQALRAERGIGQQQGRDPFDLFQTFVRNWAARSGSPFLLVLDTLEVAQFDPDMMRGIDDFLSRLTASPKKELGELKVVIAGRAPLGELRFVHNTHKPRTLRLRPLSVSDARAMASALGASRIGPAWRSAWSQRIAGSSSDGGDRREPLSIRVATDLIVSAKPDQREALSHDMAKAGEDVDESFVGRIYADRVMRHVRDPEARNLAWPGLILRKIDADLVREILAEPCNLPVSRIGPALDKLAREVWMVEPVSVAGRPMLRHRRELRARTLPMMRRQDPELFAAINKRAIEYFAYGQDDPAARAEWIYHRLLSGEEPESIDRDWRDELIALLGDAYRDFPKDSPARLYLVARTATSPAARAVIDAMPDWLAFEHLGRAGLSLAGFDDARLNNTVLNLSIRPGFDVRSMAASVAWATLSIKAGHWHATIQHEIDNRWAAAWRVAEAYRQARYPQADWFTEPSHVQSDCFDAAWMTQRLAAQSLRRIPRDIDLDAKLLELLDAPDTRVEALDAITLRTAAVFGVDCCRVAGRLWATRTYLGHPADRITFSGAELRELIQAVPPETAGEAFWRDIERVAQIALEHEAPVRIREEVLTLAMRGLLDHLMLSPGAGIDRLIRRFASRRQEDWIVPLGYAAARALRDTPSNMLSVLADRVRSYAPARSFLSSLPEIDLWRPGRRDFIALLRLADEASDLAGMIRLILETAPSSESRDELTLLSGHLASWIWEVDQFTAHAREPERNDTDPPAPPPTGPFDNDPQKGRWGGQAERDGRRLFATLTEVRKRGFTVDLSVESTDGSPLAGPVRFHLHPTFARSVITIRKIRNGRVATMYDVRAYGAFALGAQVRNASGRWIALELDLVELPGLPARFHDV